MVDLLFNEVSKFYLNNRSRKVNICLLASQFNLLKEENIMASRNRVLVPEAKAGLDRFKMEAAQEVGVNLKDGYNGDLTSREAGSIGGQMVKKMVEAYERNL